MSTFVGIFRRWMTTTETDSSDDDDDVERGGGGGGGGGGSTSPNGNRCLREDEKRPSQEQTLQLSELNRLRNEVEMLRSDLTSAKEELQQMERNEIEMREEIKRVTAEYQMKLHQAQGDAMLKTTEFRGKIMRQEKLLVEERSNTANVRTRFQESLKAKETECCRLMETKLNLEKQIVEEKCRATETYKRLQALEMTLEAQCSKTKELEKRNEDSLKYSTQLKNSLDEQTKYLNSEKTKLQSLEQQYKDMLTQEKTEGVKLRQQLTHALETIDRQKIEIRKEKNEAEHRLRTLSRDYKTETEARKALEAKFDEQTKITDQTNKKLVATVDQVKAKQDEILKLKTDLNGYQDRISQMARDYLDQLDRSRAKYASLEKSMATIENARKQVNIHLVNETTKCNYLEIECQRLKNISDEHEREKEACKTKLQEITDKQYQTEIKLNQSNVQNHEYGRKMEKYVKDFENQTSALQAEMKEKTALHKQLQLLAKSDVDKDHAIQNSIKEIESMRGAKFDLEKELEAERKRSVLMAANYQEQAIASATRCQFLEETARKLEETLKMENSNFLREKQNSKALRELAQQRTDSLKKRDIELRNLTVELEEARKKCHNFEIDLSKEKLHSAFIEGNLNAVTESKNKKLLEFENQMLEMKEKFERQTVLLKIERQKSETFSKQEIWNERETPGGSGEKAHAEKLDQTEMKHVAEGENNSSSSSRSSRQTRETQSSANCSDGPQGIGQSQMEADSIIQNQILSLELVAVQEKLETERKEWKKEKERLLAAEQTSKQAAVEKQTELERKTIEFDKKISELTTRNQQLEKDLKNRNQMQCLQNTASKTSMIGDQRRSTQVEESLIINGNQDNTANQPMATDDSLQTLAKQPLTANGGKMVEQPMTTGGNNDTMVEEAMTTTGNNDTMVEQTMTTKKENQRKKSETHEMNRVDGFESESKVGEEQVASSCVSERIKEGPASLKLDEFHIQQIRNRMKRSLTGCCEVGLNEATDASLRIKQEPNKEKQEVDKQQQPEIGPCSLSVKRSRLSSPLHDSTTKHIKQEPKEQIGAITVLHKDEEGVGVKIKQESIAGHVQSTETTGDEKHFTAEMNNMMESEAIEAEATTSALNRADPPPPHPPPPPPHHHLPPHQPQSKHHKAKLLHRLRTKKQMTGIAVVDENLFLVYERNSVVEVFSAGSFSYSGSVFITELTNPMRLTSCRLNHCVYMLNRGDSVNDIFRLGPGPQWIHSKWSIGSDFGDLAATPDATLLFSSSDFSVKEFTTQGQLLRTIKLNVKHLAGQLQLSCAVRLVSGDGQLVVSYSDLANRSRHVAIVNADGTVAKPLLAFRGSMFVQHLTVGSCAGALFLADFETGQVLRWSSQLTSVETILQSKTRGSRPLRIATDENDRRLFVAEVVADADGSVTGCRVSVYEL